MTKWLVNIKKYLFFYRDGYYELPYISNCPEVMLASFKGMPFTKYDDIQKNITSKTVFAEAIMRYRELETGFWLIATDIEFKKNICTKALYDDEPTDYFFLSYFRYTSTINNIEAKNVVLPTEGWSLYKPGTAAVGYYNAGDKGVFLDFAFDTAWFKNHIKTDNWADENAIKQYLSSAQTHILWNDIVPNAAKSMEQIMHGLQNESVGELNLLSLKVNCLSLMVEFFQSIAALHLKPDNSSSKQKETDRRHIAQAEKLLLNDLTNQFPGIEEMAKTVHMSPTKLKALFKNVYGKPMFQYYQEKQMLLAMELLLRPSSSVGQVAMSLGYENASNFTAAFKKHYGLLPSEVK
ncbi:MAG: helix-turn-helix transcriptional regulator [Chitinophagaceae bacterium]|nr:helix-turn-helix transcriptional regulator [Chitinophagaceae bacterium]